MDLNLAFTVFIKVSLIDNDDVTYFRDDLSDQAT